MEAIRNTTNEIMFVGAIYKQPDLLVDFDSYVRKKYDFFDANILFDSTYKEKEFKIMASLPKISILRDEWGIDTDSVKSKQERLELYNQKRKQKWDSERLSRLTAKETARNTYLESFKSTYMKKPHMWEFETLSMFLTDNPIKDSSQYVSQAFSQAADQQNVTVICVIVDATQEYRFELIPSIKFVEECIEPCPQCTTPCVYSNHTPNFDTV